MSVLGIDLGGTQSKLGIVEHGTVTDTFVCDTPVEAGYEAVVQSLAKGAQTLLRLGGDVKLVGLASPGLVENGVVRFSNNFGWHDRPLAADLQAALKLPVKMANDAQCAALGEALHGAGRGFSRVAMLTVGTGVGGGFIRDGQVETAGYGAFAYIFGHMAAEHNGKQCNCGRRGCLECYASATAVALAGSRMLKRDATAREIFDAARAGNASACEIVAQMADYLAQGAVNIANVLRPHLIVIGGGVSGSCDLLLPQINAALCRDVYAYAYAPVKAVCAMLGNRAGLVGAACLWKNEADSKEQPAED